MREVSGTTWTFQIMILFILIFACFLTLVLSYSKAYTVKNEMLSIIEKYEGVTEGDEGSLAIINNYLYQNSYKTKGQCPEGWYGAKDYAGTIEVSQGNGGYLYCFKEESAGKKIYYNIRLFYRFNLPVIGEIATFKVNGRTDSFIGSDSRIG